MLKEATSKIFNLGNNLVLGRTKNTFIVNDVFAEILQTVFWKQFV